MRRLVWLVAGVGLLLAGSALGHADFSIHDGNEQTEELTAPGTENLSEEELAQQYDGILNKARSSGTAPDPINSLSDVPEDETGVSVDAAGADQLPWQLLTTRLDVDQDGLSGIDERRLGTDPDNPDTDGDGFFDGVEVVRGYNPLIASPGDQVVFADPRGAPSVDSYQVTGIRPVVNNGVAELNISGEGPANSLVTIFIFSEEPFINVARTDSTGRFLKTVTNELEDGAHQAYVAGTSSDGKIVSTSGPLPFIKTGDVIDVLGDGEAGEVAEEIAVALAESGGINLWVWVAALIAVVVVAGGLLIVATRRRGHGQPMLRKANKE